MVSHARLKGSTIIIIQAIFVAFTGLFAKLAQMKGLPPFQVLFVLVLVATICLIPWFLKIEKPGKLERRDLLALVLRAFFGLFCVATYFYSLKGLPLTTALLLFNSGPLFVPFVLWIIGKRGISLEILIFILLGFLGIFLILDPQYHHIDKYYVLALLSGMLSSCVSVSTGIISRLKLLRVSIFSILLSQICIFGLVAIPNWVSFTWENISFAVLGGLAWAGTQLGFQGFKYACASVLAPLLFISVVVSGAIDWFVWHQVVDIETIVGICFVIFASVLVLTHD